MDLSAHTPVVRLTILEALEFTRGLAFVDGDIVVIGSDELALAARAAWNLGTVRAFADWVPRSAPAPAGVIRQDLDAALVSDARLVVAVLPKPHAELDEIGQLLSEHAADDVLFVGSGRDKHMSVGLNEQLAHAFTEVSASRGRWKSRALRARGIRRPAETAPYPRRARPDGLSFDVVAHGGVFAGTKLDIGTRALLDVLDQALDDAEYTADFSGNAVDLGCGTGVLATTLALRRPRAAVVATDVSWSAVASARATADAAGVGDRVTTVQADSAETLPAESADLVLLNPPFHVGAAVHERLADGLFTAAARILRSGGTLLTVYNSHLDHRRALSHLVGPTTQIARTPKFTVTRTTRTPRPAG